MNSAVSLERVPSPSDDKGATCITNSTSNSDIDKATNSRQSIKQHSRKLNPNSANLSASDSDAEDAVREDDSGERPMSFSFGHETIRFLGGDDDDNEIDIEPDFDSDSDHCNEKSSKPDRNGVAEPTQNEEMNILKSDIKYVKDTLETLELKFIEESSTHIENEPSLASNENDESFLNNLPREIIIQIFSNFSQTELCRHVLPVCKLWYRIGYDSDAWEELDFTNNKELPTIELCRVIKRAEHVRRLKLTGRSHMTVPEVVIFSSYACQLREIDLGFCECLSNAMIGHLVENCRHLQKINVEGCTLINDDSLRILAKKTVWKDLNFSHCSISDEGLKYLVSNVTGLESLNIDGISWIHDGFV